MSPSLSEAVGEFILDQSVSMNSPETVRWYSTILNSMLSHFGPQLPIALITPHDLREYIKSLRDRLADASVRSHTTALLAFWAWSSREYSTPNPAGNIKRPKPGKAAPRSAMAGDLIKLLDYLDGSTDVNVRDRAMLVLLADTGMRVGGLATLTLDRLSVADQFCIVTEKGHDVRRVPFTAYPARMLQLWLNLRATNSDSVFVNMFTGEPLTTGGITQRFKYLKRKVGITGRINPHSWRHAFARAYLEAGGDIVTLARLLGHKDVNTTAAYYAVFSDRELADLQAKYSPLRRLLAEKRDGQLSSISLLEN